MNQSPSRNPWKGHAHYEVSVECGMDNCENTEFFTSNQGVRRHMRGAGWQFVAASHVNGRAVGWVCPDHS